MKENNMDKLYYLSGALAEITQKTYTPKCLNTILFA